jgi:hypothetical protein
VGCGQIQTPIPNGLLTVSSFVAGAPWLIKHLPQANGMHMSCGMVEGCQIVDARGQRVAGLGQAQGETFVTATVELADTTPVPIRPQPASELPWMMGFISDVLLPALSVPVYRRGLRRAWGRHMAPVRAETKKWLALLGIAGAVGLLLGLILGKRRE